VVISLIDGFETVADGIEDAPARNAHAGDIEPAPGARLIKESMVDRNGGQPALKGLIAELRTITRQIATAKAEVDPRALKKMREEMEGLTRELQATTARLDPILRPDAMFDPTDPATAGRVVALTLVAQARHPLSAIPDFYGAGVYAIYYKGDYQHYRPLSGTDHPIYVGKADPVAPSAKDAVAQGTKLSGRLGDHAKSIRKATTTLNIEDFDCRFLIVQSGFQKSAEDYLINMFKPIWNSETKICFGLGKHGDSSDTRGNKRSPWDTLHPGRAWADASSENQKAPELIVEQIREHIARYRPYKDVREILDRFMVDMRQLSTDHFHSGASEPVALESSERDLFSGA
jgi:hypothetical protein